MHELPRRNVLRAGLLAGASLALTGCQSTSRRPRVTAQPVPRSSDDWSFRSHKPGWMEGQEAPKPLATPGVQPRRAWTSQGPIYSDTYPMNGVQRITVHHDGMTPFTSTAPADARQRLESIRRAHVSGNGWADIGYHFVIDPSGRVWEARPIDRQGAHVKYNNEHNLGVMVLGNYDQQYPTNAASQSLDSFVAAMMRRYRVPVSRVYTHQELRATACPGRSLQRYLEASRSRSGTLARA